MLQVCGAVDEKGREIRPLPTIVVAKHIELQAIEQHNPLPMPVGLGQPLANQVPANHRDSVGRQAVREQKCRKSSQLRD